MLEQGRPHNLAYSFSFNEDSRRLNRYHRKIFTFDQMIKATLIGNNHIEILILKISTLRVTLVYYGCDLIENNLP